jgi:16S rRNA (uracil1498-N3)-methyltransferase
MSRVFISPDDVEGRLITIRDPRALHHLVRVLRVGLGDPIECLDGSGRAYQGRVLRRGSKELVVEIAGESAGRSIPLEIHLGVALIRPERFEWMVEKATELGVSAILPLVTARTIVRVPVARVEARLQRWRRIAVEAAQQCGVARVPAVHPPQVFNEAVAALAGPSALTLMPTLALKGAPLREALEGLRTQDRVAALIGPEGDFTPEEASEAQRHGARPVSLGALVLRTETAALALATALRYATGLL